MTARLCHYLREKSEEGKWRLKHPESISEKMSNNRKTAAASGRRGSAAGGTDGGGRTAGGGRRGEDLRCTRL